MTWNEFKIIVDDCLNRKRVDGDIDMEYIHVNYDNTVLFTIVRNGNLIIEDSYNRDDNTTAEEIECL